MNPEDQTLSDEMRILVATAMNCKEASAKLAQFISTQKDTLQAATKDVERPTVYLAGNSSFLSTAGAAMYQNSLIELAGGQNVAAEIADTYWAEIDYEQLLAWNPEYIILAADADYTVEDVLADENLAGCTAVQNKNVYHMPNKAESWDSPVPGSILGAVWLNSVLQDSVSEDSANAIIEEFYETFYGFSYNR